MQICRRDWLNGLWTLHSFFRAAGAPPFRVVLLSDKSVGAEVLGHYRRLFPGICIPEAKETEALALRRLAPLAPTLFEMWREGTYFTLPKVLDSWLWSANPRWLCVDPDVLFFLPPKEMLDYILGGTADQFLWNVPQDKGHCDGTYCFTPRESQLATSLSLPARFQIGCGGVDAKGFDWVLAEQLFRQMPVPRDLIFMVDQTLFGLFAAKHGFRGLPEHQYCVEPVESLEGVVARHYYGKTRDLFYVEGIAALLS